MSFGTRERERGEGGGGGARPPSIVDRSFWFIYFFGNGVVAIFVLFLCLGDVVVVRGVDFGGVSLGLRADEGLNV